MKLKIPIRVAAQKEEKCTLSVTNQKAKKKLGTQDKKIEQK